MKKFIPIIILILLLCIGCGESKKTSVQDSFSEEMAGSENKNQTDVNKSGHWEDAYASFLDGLYNNNTLPDEKDFEFAILDLDKDGTDELIVVSGGSDLSVYTFKDSVVEVGHHDFVTGTTKFFVSSNIEYSGIFCFSVDGGYEWHRYIGIEDNLLKIEDLWNEDCSGISEVLGDKRDRIKEFSSDKALIQESKKVYEENQVLVLKDMIPSNYNSLEKTTEVIFTNKYKDNPIDKYIDKRLEDDNLPFSERRDIKRLYFMLWESEYDNVMSFIKEKCENDEDKNKIAELDGEIEKYIEGMSYVMEISYHISKEPEDRENVGLSYGADSLYNEGEIYRDICMLLIEKLDGEYVFLDRDYDEIVIP